MSVALGTSQIDRDCWEYPMEIKHQFISDQDIADLLKISKERLFVKICEGTSDLPAYIKLPGSRVRLWPLKDLEEWLNSNKVKVALKGEQHGN